MGLQASSSGTVNGDMFGGNFGASFSGTGGITNLYGGFFAGYVTQSSSTTVTLPNLYGGYFKASSRGKSGITNLVGGLFELENASLSGQNPAVTNAYGILIKDTMSYSPTNLYGIYIPAMTDGATLNYGIYTNAGLIHFGDSVDLSSGKNITLVAGNIVTDTTTGTKIGTGTTQKIGFWNTTPIVQPTTSVGTATFTANSGTAINDASTFDSYTIKQVVKALRNVGILA
jgi:hypothetical protein